MGGYSVASIGMATPDFNAGDLWKPPEFGFLTVTAENVGQCDFVAVDVTRPVAVADLCIDVTVVAGAGGTATFAVYRDDGTRRRPSGLPVVQSAPVSTEVLALRFGACPVTLPTGRSWLAKLTLVAAATIRTAPGAAYVPFTVGATTLAGMGLALGGLGALPNITPAIAATLVQANVPACIGVRTA